MIRPVVLFLAFVATAAFATAAPRFALVRVTDIYTGLPSTKKLQEEVEAKREAVLHDERAEELRKIIAELQALQARLADRTTPLEPEEGRKLAHTYEVRRQEAQTLQQEFENYRAEMTKEINKEMVAAMRVTLDRIVEISRKLAKEQGFDAVWDSSGNSNTGVEVILYSKNAKDLTSEVIAALQDAEAAPPVSGSNPE